MSRIRGSQIAEGADGISTANLTDGVLSADAAGRAKIAASYFDLDTVIDKFVSGSIPVATLQETVIKADGTIPFTGEQDFGDFKITGVGDGTDPTDAVNKSQLDAVAAGLSWKDAVKASTTANISATYTDTTGSGVGAILSSVGSFPAQDDISLVVGDRLLVKNQTNAYENGIYVLVQDNGTWILERSPDCDEAGELDSAATYVQKGTINVDRGYVQTASDITPSVTDLNWVQFSGPGIIVSQIIDDKGLTPFATSGNQADSGLTIANTPGGYGYVRVEVNGVGYTVGNGTTSEDCYFSGDSGTTSKSFGNIVSGDALYWNGTNAGFDLITADRIDFFYET